jgi:esterase/lipase superfamily enzyme
VTIGDGISWEELVEASRSEVRAAKLQVALTRTQELGRFGPTPPKLVLTDAEMAERKKPGFTPPHAAAEQGFREYLAARLAQTPRKEVFVYVHGYANTLEDAVQVTAEMWHFLGREGVPLCYTWPAGPASIKGYEYTLASTQFTVFHLKQTLRRIAACPEVEKVNIIAHSRGTAVITEAVRELHLELRSTTDTQ